MELSIYCEHTLQIFLKCAVILASVKFGEAAPQLMVTEKWMFLLILTETPMRSRPNSNFFLNIDSTVTELLF